MDLTHCTEMGADSLAENTTNASEFRILISVQKMCPKVPCPCFPLFNHYFYEKTKPLYSHPK